MKIALISDVHGNLTALKTVLEDIEKRGVDEIYCLGDTIAKGINSSECISLVREKCKVVLKGNTDDYYVVHTDDEDLGDKIYNKRVRFNQDLMSKEDMEYLNALPITHEFYLSGSLVRIFHSSPYSPYDRYSYVDPKNIKIKLFMPSEYTSDKWADIACYGHLHTQFQEKMYNRTLINVGSVGNSTDIVRDRMYDASPLETTQAFYTILEGEYGVTDKTKYPLVITNIRIPYDIEKELSYNEKNIELEAYTQELKNGMYRDYNLIKNDFESKLNK